jgi:hypothetical protein
MLDDESESLRIGQAQIRKAPRALVVADPSDTLGMIVVSARKRYRGFI